jgi:hypothetical protein
MQWMPGVGGFLLMVAFWVFGFVQLAAGFIGIEHYFSSFWAWTALLIAIFFRFTLPIIIGAFLCGPIRMEMSLGIAILFVLPGLVFVIPGLLRPYAFLAHRA